jgi:hypothetical protein
MAPLIFRIFVALFGGGLGFIPVLPFALQVDRARDMGRFERHTESRHSSQNEVNPRDHGTMLTCWLAFLWCIDPMIGFFFIKVPFPDFCRHARGYSFNFFPQL